jgi:FkbM family methyltransferase
MQPLKSWVFERIRPVAFRGKVRLLNSRLRNSGTETALVFGYHLPLDLRNFVDRMIYLGTFEPLNTHRFRKLLRPGMTVVDVGANIGYFSLLAARLVGPAGKVVALEPHPLNFAILEQAKIANAIGCLTPLRLGLGDASGDGHIGMFDQEKYPNRTASMVGAGEGHPSVPMLTLDALVEREGIPHIDLLKIDVDGFETRIIAGARKSLERGIIGHLIIEFNDFWLSQSGSSAARLAEMIQAGGLIDKSREDRLAGLFLGASEDRRYSRG